MMLIAGYTDIDPKHMGPALLDENTQANCSDEHGQKMGWGCIDTCPMHDPTAYASIMARHRADR